MIAAQLILLSLLAGDPKIDALVAAARGVELLGRREIDAALAELYRARDLAPESSAIQRDLAIAEARAGRDGAALASIERAIQLGDPSREALHLRAMLLARLGRSADAASAARAAGDWQGALLGTTAGDPAAADRVTALIGEATPRGALTALVLSGSAAERGERSAAILLATAASEAAAGSGLGGIADASRTILDRIGEEGDRLATAARVRAAVEYATNPAYIAEGLRTRVQGLRLGFGGEAAIRIPAGTARIDAALRADQQVYLAERDALRDVALTGFTVSAGVEIPLNNKPDAAAVGFSARFTDVFGDFLDVHHATSIEAGPTLEIPLEYGLHLDLGIYGVAADFIDGSPADNVVSSQNRDHIGQRALAAVLFRSDWLDARAHAMFLHDDAAGSAFDSRGGALAGRLVAHLGGGLSLTTALAVTARQFGPVGEEAVIGPASKRAEVRTVVEIGAHVPLTDLFSVFVEDVYLRNSGRDRHEYTSNVISLGMEASW